AVVEGLDYEATYILESSIFGHGDWGRLTTTVNGTWLSRFVFSSFPTPNTKPFGLAGLFFVGNGFPWHRASFSLYYDGPRDTWMQGLDAGAVVHWTGQYNEENLALRGKTTPHKAEDNDLITVKHKHSESVESQLCMRHMCCMNCLTK